MHIRIIRRMFSKILLMQLEFGAAMVRCELLFCPIIQHYIHATILASINILISFIILLYRSNIRINMLRIFIMLQISNYSNIKKRAN